MEEVLEFEDPLVSPNIVKVIGVGGGGSNAVSHMYTEGIFGVDFIVCNTDLQALEKSPVASKIRLGELGAGNNPEVARVAAEAARDNIKEMLLEGKNTSMVFITACMGGGTGTGASPVIASVARELGIVTVGIVTIPFTVEGKRRQMQAQQGIAEMKKYTDAIIIISNDKLRDQYGNMKLVDAYKQCDEVLRTAAKSIAEIITVTGFVNVDFNDFKTVIQNSGKAIMGSGNAEGENRATEAAKIALASPLLDDADVRGAKNVLVYITDGTDTVTVDEVTAILDYIQEETGNTSDLIWGNGHDVTLGNKINVSIVATGFDEKEPQILEEHLVETPRNQMLTKENQPQQETKQPEPEKPQAENDTRITVTPVVSEDVVIIEEPVIEEKQETVDEVVEKPQNPTIPVIQVNFDPQKDAEESVDEETIVIDEDEEFFTVTPIEDATPSTPVSEIEPSTPQVTRFESPFSQQNDDDNDYGVKIEDKASTNTLVIHDVKTEKKPMTQTEREEIIRRERMKQLSNLVRSKGFEELQKEPAYKRKGLVLDANIEDEINTSRTVMTKDGLKIGGNTFFNDNVD